MNKELFLSCSKIANNNLINKGKGNLRDFISTYLKLSQSLGNEQVAYEAVSYLPPQSSLKNPANIDDIVAFCEQNLNNLNVANTLTRVK